MTGSSASSGFNNDGASENGNGGGGKGIQQGGPLGMDSMWPPPPFGVLKLRTTRRLNNTGAAECMEGFLSFSKATVDAVQACPPLRWTSARLVTSEITWNHDGKR